MLIGLFLIVLASLVFPLPGIAIDLLLVVSNLYAFWLVFVVCQSKKSEEVTFLPTGLLTSTILRLSLNVATTRAILSGHSTGLIIEALGRSMTKDGLFTALIIFAVISIIMMIVVAKGAERVAEVSARFTLDALPGRQMTIDADIRSGLISFETAQERRQSLQTESKLCGALDGCMKFIKGDAIAGIVILTINLLGGLTIAVFLHQMDILAAISHYSALTIGDGLVSQVPSFLNALSAGLILTKIETPKNFIAGRAAKFKQKLFTNIKSEDEVNSTKVISPADRRLNWGFQFYSEQELKLDLDQIKTTIEIILKEISQEIGVALAKPEIDSKLGKYKVIFQVRGITLVNKVLSEAEVSDIKKLEPVLKQIIQNEIVYLVDDNVIRRLLEESANTGNNYAFKVLDQDLFLEFSKIIKELLKEAVSICDIDLILEAFCEALKENDGRRKLEKVRQAIGLRICAQYSDQGKLACYILSAALDNKFREAEEVGGLISDSLVIEVIEQFRLLPSHSLILTSARSRALVRDYCRLYKIALNVIAFEEVVSPFSIDLLGQIIEGQGEPDLLGILN